MAIDKKSLKKMFPHLYNELETSENKVSIDALRKNPLEAEKAAEGEESEEEEFAPALRRLISYAILILVPWILFADVTLKRRQKK